MSHLNNDYDMDDVSITSAAESPHEELYNIERILSEGWAKDGGGNLVRKYLIEWENYPMHACTWEPEGDLLDTDLLREWNREKKRIGPTTFHQFLDKNEAAFDKAYEQYQEDKALKKQKRERKRSKLEARRIIAEDSDDDTPLQQRQRVNQQRAKAPMTTTSASQELYNDLFVDSQDSNPLDPPPTLGQLDEDIFVEQPPVPRKAPLEQSSSDSGEVSSSSSDTEDSLMGELAQKSSARKAGLGNSLLSAKSPRTSFTTPHDKPALKHPKLMVRPQDQTPKLSRALTAPSAASASKDPTIKQTPKRPSEPVSQRPAAVSKKRPIESEKRPSAATAPAAAKTAKSISAEASSQRKGPTAIRKSGTGSKSAIRMTNEPRKQKRKEWQSDKHYGTLMFRHKADVRSRREGTPDPSALQFVGSVPAGLFKQKTSAPKDNPYGRREGGNRRMQEIEVDEPLRRRSIEESDAMHHPETEKAPLVCPHWRLSNNCPYGPRKCVFMHQNQDEYGYDLPVGDMSGILPPKYRKPPLTCYFWFMNPAGCRKPDVECLFAHRNTGWIPQEGQKGGQPFQIDPNTPPVSEQSTRHTAASVRPKDNVKVRPSEVTCFYWSRGTCRHTSESCKYQHRNTGIVAHGPNVSLTCPHWKRGNCKFSADVCLYAHFDTEQIPDTDMIDMEAPRFRADSPSHMAQSPPELHPASIQPLTLPSLVERPITTTLCLQLKQSIEKALDIDFNSLFEWGKDENGQVMLDRRAFLAYHPEYHAEELDILTRWLLMHHVEVSNAWFDGCWDYFKTQIAKGGSGIVLAHPDFEEFSQLQGFGQLLRKKVRIWSLGVQEGIEYNPAVSDSPSETRHNCIEIFPAGGFIYVTDDVFEKEPQSALRIMKLFFAKIEKLRDSEGGHDTSLFWRLCVRPELMEYLMQRCEEQEHDLEAGNADVLARAELYTLLTDTDYIEQDSPVQPFSAVPDEFPIMSERRIIAEEQPINYFDALARSQEEADWRMIQYYAALQVDMRRDYRHFFVVHTEPSAVGKWKEEIQTISDMITPEQCIKELSKSGNEGGEHMVDFCERFISSLKVK